jgi:hypothetical protein
MADAAPIDPIAEATRGSMVASDEGRRDHECEIGL